LDTSGGLDDTYNLIFRMISSETSNDSSVVSDLTFTVTVDQVMPLSSSGTATQTSNLDSKTDDTSRTNIDKPQAAESFLLGLTSSTSTTNTDNGYLPAESTTSTPIEPDNLLTSLGTENAASKQIKPIVPAGLMSLSTSARLDFELIATSKPTRSFEPITLSKDLNDTIASQQLSDERQSSATAFRSEPEDIRQSRLAVGVLTFWNLLRSHLSNLLAVKDTENVDEYRPIARATKREDGEEDK
jgi:hypothetical protein